MYVKNFILLLNSIISGKGTFVRLVDDDFLKRKHKCWSKPLLLTLVYKTALFLYNFQKKSVFTLAVSSEIEYLSTPGIVEGTVYVLLHERRKFDRL